MILYRIAKNEYIRDLNGTGARRYGGRWNKPGIPVLYTSEARSLALLELIVHFNSAAAIKLGYSFLSIEVDEQAIHHLPEDLQPNLLTQMNTLELSKITEEYFYPKNTLALKVPSMLVPSEYNYLLNPAHPDYPSLKVLEIQPALLDQRFESFLKKHKSAV